MTIHAVSFSSVFAFISYRLYGCTDDMRRAFAGYRVLGSVEMVSLWELTLRRRSLTGRLWMAKTFPVSEEVEGRIS